MKFLTHLILSMPLVGAYSMFAIGIVVIYRSSRVLNLAHGAMAVIPAYMSFSLVNAGLPLILALPAGIVAGSAIGLIVERVFIRGLRHMSVTAQTVGTVAVLSVATALTAKVWGTAPRQAPNVFPSGSVGVGAGELQFGAIGLFIVAVLLGIGMLALFKFTDLGLAMRGAAENRRAATLMGINPDRTAAVAWALGGALAGLAGILLSAVTILHPYALPLQMLPAFVAALLGGLESVPGALVGSAIVGILLGLVPATSSVPILGRITSQNGAAELALTVAALVIMYMRGQRFAVATKDEGALASAGGGDLRRSPLSLSAILVLLIPLALWVWLPGVSHLHLANANQALTFTIIGFSLVVLTGWVGQISLGHAALVGVGAFGTGLLARNFGIPFPFNLPVAAGGAALVAVLLGAVALRVRGLYLAVATLIFSWMTDVFLFRSPWILEAGGSSTIESVAFGVPGGFPNFDLSKPKTIYYFALAVAAVGLVATANLRTSKTGRAFFAVRGSETAAASLGIDVIKYKLLAFGVSGFLAGAAGNLIIIEQRTIVPDQFGVPVSLFYLSIAVVAGLKRLGAVALVAVLFAALDQLFFDVPALAGYLEVVSSGLLVTAILLQAHSQALAPLRGLLQGVGASALGSLSRAMRPLERTSRRAGQIGSEFSRGLIRSVSRGRRPKLGDRDSTGPPVSVPHGSESPNGRRSEPDSIVLEGREITVRFGGLTAVSNASLLVRRGQIVGLIGPNGAGKTTFFNALSGLNRPTHGSIWMFGRDVSDAPVHARAKMGLARTFQVLQLFSDLTVRENLLVATHVHNPSGFVRHMFATDRAIAEEVRAQNRVREVIDLLQLGEVADRPVAGLPFGLLRMVELARAIVTDASVILLDEPASGLDNAETDRFSGFIRSLRDEADLSILLIEHDVRMVTSVSDYIYVLNMGEIISSGTPEEIQRDPVVVSAYLGESEEGPKSDAMVVS